MSSDITTRAIQGAIGLMSDAQGRLKTALREWGSNAPVGLPGTTYYLPTILGLTGHAVEKAGDLQAVLELSRKLLVRKAGEPAAQPDLDAGLNAGMAALLAAETIEALLFLEGGARHEADSGLRRLVDGPINDDQVRSLGTDLAEARIPGVALIHGCSADEALAVKIIAEMRRSNVLCLLVGNMGGRSITHRLQKEGVGVGPGTGVLPLGAETTAMVHATGFVTHAAIAMGRLKPGMTQEILDYSKNRLPGFTLALGELDDLQYALAAGAMCFGFPLITDSAVSRNAPAKGKTGAGVGSIPLDRLRAVEEPEQAACLVQECIEVRGLKVKASRVDLPVPYGRGFEGEAVPDAHLSVEFGGEGSCGFELLQTMDLDAVTDGKIELIGQDLAAVQSSTERGLGLVVQVAGRRMKSEFEPVLERQFHNFINGARGIEHRGRRDAVRIRISDDAAASGIGLDALGRILCGRFHEDFGEVVEKIQVRVITDPRSHAKWLQAARAAYGLRDKRLAGFSDAGVDEFYSCAACKPMLPESICIISPERPSPCGAYDWLDCQSMFDMDGGGPIQPVQHGEPVSAERGMWDGVNRWVTRASRGVLDQVSLHSIMESPPTTCGHPECIAMVIPEANGVMIVSRDDESVTPTGLTFAALSEIVNSGRQVSGVMGIGKSYLISPKFISAEGGFRRVVWMSSVLKDSMSNELGAVCERQGDPNLLNKIADERSATTVHDLMAWLQASDHPARALAPIF